MILVSDIFDESKKIIGECSNVKFFRWVSDAVSIVANKMDPEGLKGYLDICTLGCNCNGSGCNNDGTRNGSQCCGRRCVALPREVGNILAVNIGGQPTLGFGQTFSFHLNGPGDCKQTCDWSWYDQGGFHSTYRDLINPAKLVAYLQTPEDNGKRLVVYGYDNKGQVLRRNVNGEWLNGYQVPTIFGYAIPDAEAPLVARITAVDKEPTVGNVRLSTVDDSGATGVLLGVYEPDETLPQFRRIRLNRACNWVRIAFRRKLPVFTSMFDHIPMASRVAFLLAMTARKRYSEYQLGEAHAFEADALRLEVEAQQAIEPPTYDPIQVVDRSNARDKSDYDVR